MQFADAVGYYLQDCVLRGLANGTVDEYDHRLRTIQIWFSKRGVHETHDITPALCRAFLTEFRQGRSQATLCHVRSILHTWLLWIQDNGILIMDPRALPSVPPPKPDEIRRLFLSERQTGKLFRQLRQEYRDARNKGGTGLLELRGLCVAGLLFGVGLRISEVAAMEIANIDWHEHELYIPHTKTSRPRYVVVGQDVRAYLRAYMRLRAQVYMPSHWLFPSRHSDTHIKPKALANRLRASGQRAGVFLTTHTGRRYCLTRMAQTNLEAARRQAGHAVISTTAKYIEPDRQIIHQIIEGATLPKE